MGAVLTAAKNYEEAEQQLLKSYDALKNQRSISAKHSLRKVYSRLAKLYDAQGKVELAAAYSDTLAELKKIESGWPQ